MNESRLERFFGHEITQAVLGVLCGCAIWFGVIFFASALHEVLQ